MDQIIVPIMFVGLVAFVWMLYIKAYLEVRREAKAKRKGRTDPGRRR